jgi:hypothetical protein
MDSIILMVLGYFIWCVIAFVVARAMNIENANKAMSFIYVIAAAPLVLIDYIKGIGSS